MVEAEARLTFNAKQAIGEMNNVTGRIRRFASEVELIGRQDLSSLSNFTDAFKNLPLQRSASEIEAVNKQLSALGSRSENLGRRLGRQAQPLIDNFKSARGELKRFKNLQQQGIDIGLDQDTAKAAVEEILGPLDRLEKKTNTASGALKRFFRSGDRKLFRDINTQVRTLSTNLDSLSYKNIFVPLQGGKGVLKSFDDISRSEERLLSKGEAARLGILRLGADMRKMADSGRVDSRSIQILTTRLEHYADAANRARASGNRMFSGVETRAIASLRTNLQGLQQTLHQGALESKQSEAELNGMVKTSADTSLAMRHMSSAAQGVMAGMSAARGEVMGAAFSFIFMRFAIIRTLAIFAALAGSFIVLISAIRKFVGLMKSAAQAVREFGKEAQRLASFFKSAKIASAIEDFADRAARAFGIPREEARELGVELQKLNNHFYRLGRDNVNFLTPKTFEILQNTAVATGKTVAEVGEEFSTLFTDPPKNLKEWNKRIQEFGKEYDVVLKNVDSSGDILGALDRRFPDAAAKQAETLDGNINRLSSTFETFKIVIGALLETGLIPVIRVLRGFVEGLIGGFEAAEKVDDATGRLHKEIKNFRQTMERLLPIMYSMGVAIGSLLYSTMRRLAGATKALTDAFIRLWSITKPLRDVFGRLLQSAKEWDGFLAGWKIPVPFTAALAKLTTKLKLVEFKLPKFPILKIPKLTANSVDVEIKKIVPKLTPEAAFFKWLDPLKTDEITLAPKKVAFSWGKLFDKIKMPKISLSKDLILLDIPNWGTNITKASIADSISGALKALGILKIKIPNISWDWTDTAKLGGPPKLSVDVADVNIAKLRPVLSAEARIFKILDPLRANVDELNIVPKKTKFTFGSLLEGIITPLNSGIKALGAISVKAPKMSLNISSDLLNFKGLIPALEGALKALGTLAVAGPKMSFTITTGLIKFTGLAGAVTAASAKGVFSGISGAITKAFKGASSLSLAKVFRLGLKASLGLVKWAGIGLLVEIGLRSIVPPIAAKFGLDLGSGIAGKIWDSAFSIESSLGGAIGLAVGAVIGSVVPGFGTAIGGGLGFAIGTAIGAGAAYFRDEIGTFLGGAITKFKDFVKWINERFGPLFKVVIKILGTFVWETVKDIGSYLTAAATVMYSIGKFMGKVIKGIGTAFGDLIFFLGDKFGPAFGLICGNGYSIKLLSTVANKIREHYLLMLWIKLLKL